MVSYIWSLQWLQWIPVYLLSLYLAIRHYLSLAFSFSWSVFLVMVVLDGTFMASGLCHLWVMSFVDLWWISFWCSTCLRWHCCELLQLCINCLSIDILQYLWWRENWANNVGGLSFRVGHVFSWSLQLCLLFMCRIFQNGRFVCPVI